MPAFQTAPENPVDGGIRRLWPADRQDFLAHLMRLDAESRHDRVGGAVSG